jgi:DOMON domain
MMMKLCSILFVCMIFAAPSKADLDAQFVGVWHGVPYYSELGPFPSNTSVFTFKVASLQNSASEFDYLLSDDFPSGQSIVPGSQQQFWVNSTELIYCGALRNFFPVVAPVRVVFHTVSSPKNMAKWCIDAACTWQWTLSLSDDGEQLHSQVLGGKPVVHLDVVFNRVHGQESAAALLDLSQALPPPCNVSTARHPPVIDAPSAKQRVCPFAHRHRKLPPPPPAHDKAATLSFCYVFNEAVDYRLAWTMDLERKLLHVTMSAPKSEARWIGIGFGGDFPGMRGADIVIAYRSTPATGGLPCVRPLHADLYVGPPSADNATLSISDTSIDDSGDRLSASFTRPFVSGHRDVGGELPMNVLWAVGQSVPAGSCGTAPVGYHGNTRGRLVLGFAAPYLELTDLLKCSQ